MKNKNVFTVLQAVSLLLVSCLVAPASYGQVVTTYGDFSIDQTIASWSGDNEFTFTAPEAGHIVQLRFNTNQSGPTATLNIYDIHLTCISPQPPMNLLGSSAPHTPTAGINVVTFSPPIPIAAGQTVYIWPADAWNIHPSSDSVDYPYVGNYDFGACPYGQETEELSVEIDVQTGAQAVPTASAWALIVLSLSVVSLGSASLLSRNTAARQRVA